MHRILFICHGNICRSPMAEMIMKELVRASGREDEFVIASAATDTDEIGSDIYPPAKAVMRAHGIPFTRRGARLVTSEDLEKYDLFVVMDRENVSHLVRNLGDGVVPKIHKMLPDREVSDPWYTRDFERAFRDIEEGCRALLAEFTPT